METEIEIPALSRPFTLGMLYDARSDKLIPGISLWSVQKLDDIRKNQKTEKTSIEILASDSISAKSSSIKASAEIKASLIAGLIDLSGSGEFLIDNKTSGNQTRVSLKYSLTDRFEQLDMKHLASSAIEFPEGFNVNSATHVVVAIEFGLDAYFVFDMNKEEEKALVSAGGSLKAEVTKLSGIFSFDKSGANAKVAKSTNRQNVQISCKYHGDFSLGDSNPVSFEDAMKLYIDLPQIAKRATKVPQRVWLYPLSSLNKNAARIVKSIGVKIIESFENQCQGLLNSRAMANALLEDKVIASFAHLKSDLEKYIQAIDRFDLVFKEYLRRILPEIRGSGIGEVELDKLSQLLQLSPLGQTRDEFLKKIQQESLLLKTYLDKLVKNGIIVDNDIIPWENYFTENVNKVISLSIDPFPRGDFLININEFINSFPNPQNYQSNNPMWFEIENIRGSSTNVLNNFLSFLNCNKSNSIKFIAQFSSRQNVANTTINNLESIFIIWFYEEGSKANIILPTKPQDLFIDPNTVTNNELVLSWKKCPPNATISKFTINIFTKFDSSKSQRETKNGEQCKIKIDQLKPGEIYQFSVQANCAGGMSEESEKTIEISIGEKQISEDERIAIKVKNFATKVDDAKSRKGKTTIFKPLMKLKYNGAVMLSDGQNGGIRKYEIGETSKVYKWHKVILLVGATGSGKTTFINSLANYIFDVRAEDEFRFKIVTEADQAEETKPTTPSTFCAAWNNCATRFVSAYCFCSSKLSYQLTIVDTPGCSDTAGSQMDKETTKFIKLLFETPGEKGIDQLNAVCFVVKHSDTKLSPGNKYLLDSLIALFGTDMQESLIPIITFSDASDPPVLQTLQDANISFQENLWFSFNNSAVFKGKNMTQFQKNFWDLGNSSFSSFFERLQTISPKSIVLTKQVLRRREELENHVLTTQQRIDNEVSALDIMKQEAEVIKVHKKDIELNKEFTYTLKELIMVPESIEGSGIYTTTCLTCNFTCHYHCKYSDDDSKYKCVAFENESCKECPKRCNWKMHKSISAIYVRKERSVTKTDKDIKTQYNEGIKGEVKQSIYLENVVKQSIQKQKYIMSLLSEIRKCLNELQKIARLPTNLTEIDYLENIIQSEKSRRDIGWDKRIEHLELQLKLAQQVNARADPNFNPLNISAETFKEIVQLVQSQPLLQKNILNEKIQNCKVQ